MATENNEGRAVETAQAACGNFQPLLVRSVPVNMCGYCRYCDKEANGGFMLISEKATCHYPTMVK